MKFRKKPVVIDAIKWDGNNLKEVIEFTGRHERFDEWFKSWEEYEERVKSDGGIFKIFTLEGVMEASIGDMIIRGVNGEYYPCKPDIFEKTYEAVESTEGEDALREQESQEKMWVEAIDTLLTEDKFKLMQSFTITRKPMIVK